MESLSICQSSCRFFNKLMTKYPFQTAYAMVYLMSKFIIQQTYAKNSISESLVMPKFLARKTFFLKVFAKTRNQFLWLQFVFFCDWLRMKLRCDFFYWSRFSNLHWFRNCYFRFQNLFLKWQNNFFFAEISNSDFLLKILLVQ